MILKVALITCLDHLLIYIAPCSSGDSFHLSVIGISIDVEHRYCGLYKHLTLYSTSSQLISGYVLDYFIQVNHFDKFQLLWKFDNLRNQLLGSLWVFLYDFEKKSKAARVKTNNRRF